MKLSGFIIFLIIVLAIYFSVNLYIFFRGWQALPKEGSYRFVYFVVMVLLILAYPAGRFLEHVFNKGISEFLIHLGAYYLAVMVFTFFLVLVIDVVRFGNHFIHFLPNSWYKINSPVKWISFLSVLGIVAVVTVAGAWNARMIHIKKISIQVNKPAASIKKLNIVLVSDIHLGTIIHNSKLQTIVNKINKLDPDIVLLAGDIFDEDITALIEKNTASILTKLKSKYGVFAIPGNHEYFSGIDEAIEYLQQGQITVLRDSSAFVGKHFYLVGRDDRTASRFNLRRKPLEELMVEVDKKFPVILMDHQPFNLEEAEQNGVDLQVSGHTHHGQFFPFNLVTNKVYELSWGYKQKGKTHYFVSCGVGTWGPPVRLGNRPEIVNIEIVFSGN